MLVYHIMPYVMDTPKSIFPRVPQNHMFSEDTKQPRICVSPSLDDCLTAIGLDFVGITFAKNIITTKSQNPISELTFPFVIRTYDITQNTESILHNVDILPTAKAGGFLHQPPLRSNRSCCVLHDVRQALLPVRPTVRYVLV